MNTFEFINYLRSLNIKLSVKGDRLLYKDPQQKLSKDLQAEIKERKTYIINILKQSQNRSSLPLQSVSREQKLPLSFAQQRLWFIDQLEGKSPVYNWSILFSVQGKLNIPALEKALMALIQRHETLRTNFTNTEEGPTLIIHSQVNFHLPLINLENLPPNQQERERENIIQQELLSEFDLEKDSLIRSTLIKTAPEKYIFMVVMHHIISDGWSMNILTKEISGLYGDFKSNHPVSLPPLPIQYADFAFWQRQWLTGEVLQTKLNYWQKQLEGIPPLIELPLDQPRPPVQTFVGKLEAFKLNTTITKQLKDLARDNGVTLYIILLSAFAVLLSRYTHQSDLVIGSPIANRNYQEIEGLIGFFVNSLALRINLAENPCFKELLTRVKQVAFEAYEHQHLPFEKLVEELNPERNLSHHPIFQVMFVLQNTSNATLELEELKVKLINGKTNTAKFNLTLSITENQELHCIWEYNTDLFYSDTVKRMSGHFQTLLGGIINNPEQKISLLPLLTEAETDQILIDWNNTQVDYPQNKCIHQLFEEQVEHTPEAIAVVYEDQQLTYRELNEKANQLAHYLQELGVGPQVLVGICLERSPLMIVGLLAILKAGGAYLPLAPHYPRERIEFMVVDAQVPVLLTKQTLLETLSFPGINLICIDSDWQDIQLQDRKNPQSTTKSDNLAYVIYTSGSTGIPKGVAIPHKAVNRLVLNTNYINLTSSDRIAQASNVSFDAATFEIWGALLNGASLIGIEKEILLSPPDLVSYLQKYQIKVLFITTALLNQIASIIPQAFESLRYLLFGGEAVNPQWVRAILSSGAPQNLIHVYGPTENTTFSSWYLIKQVPEEVNNIPIGSPIANTQMYILDQNLNPVAIGVSGELYLGGDGLAKGYLNRPELTLERFITNPFEQEEGSKLYKTGDRVRYLGDGSIEFLGRLDNQLKIRGFRIEPGEIESYLSQYPNIKETVVIAGKNQQGEPYLAAYVLTKQNQQFETIELRQFLLDKLPEYMIPSVFVFLDAFPLTANGKINRQALPEPDFQTNRAQEFIVPRNQTETKLARIWQEVLGIEKVGINDNFFRLGGHSLLATQVVSRIRNSFKVELPLRSLFKFPTIGKLSQHLSNSYLAKSMNILPQNQDRERGEI